MLYVVVQILTNAGDDQSEAATAKLKGRVAGVGTIALQAHRMHGGSLGPRGTDYGGRIKLHELGTVPEKALKGQALSHSTRYDLEMVDVRKIFC